MLGTRLNNMAKAPKKSAIIIEERLSILSIGVIRAPSPAPKGMIADNILNNEPDIKP